MPLIIGPNFSAATEVVIDIRDDRLTGPADYSLPIETRHRSNDGDTFGILGRDLKFELVGSTDDRGVQPASTAVLLTLDQVRYRDKVRERERQGDTVLG